MLNDQLSQSEPSILMLYIPLTVLIHQVMVASCAGHYSMLNIEYKLIRLLFFRCRKPY